MKKLTSFHANYRLVCFAQEGEKIWNRMRLEEHLARKIL